MDDRPPAPRLTTAEFCVLAFLLSALAIAGAVELVRSLTQ